MNLRRLASLGALLLAATGKPAWAQDVALTGISSGRALLVINGGPPRFLATGQSRDGVRVLNVGADSVTVEVGGQRQALRLGMAPLNTEPAADRDTPRIVLQADGAGHFITAGQINGKAVQFLVDTGATTVVLSQADADRIGFKAGDGEAVRISTANGMVQGRAIRLSSVRVGTAQVYEVMGVIMPQPMPYVLLGNSFLSRFQMQRTNDQLVLEKRF